MTWLDIVTNTKPIAKATPQDDEDVKEALLAEAYWNANPTPIVFDARHGEHC